MKIGEHGGMMVPGEFYPLVHNGELLLPGEFTKMFPKLGDRIDSAEDLISRLTTFPSEFVDLLGWEPDMVKKATRKLQECCKTYLPEPYHPDWVSPFNPSYGALPPES